MRALLPSFAAALSLAFAAPMIAAGGGPALAQEQKAGAEAPKQVALTDKQIDAYVGAKKDIDAIIAKLPEDASDKPDPKVMAQLDGVAKKNKFADYAEYEAVDASIGAVMEGIDPQTKKYVGGEAVLKQQIAAVKAEKGMSPKDKKEALDQLNDALKSIATVQFPANVQLVSKNFDKISAVMPQDQGEGGQKL
jgi:hypothetical protein